MAKFEQQTVYPGIPQKVSLEFARDWARPRISEKRFNHVQGVAKTGRKLAKHAGVDPFLSELAGWLHDACKEVKAAELYKMAKDFGLKLDGFDESNGHLLHGPIAAEVVKRELQITHEPLLDAIRQHTMGEVDMTDLSKVAYLADCLEESRPRDFTDPIWTALGWRPGGKDEGVDLDKAMLVACDLGLQHLIESGKAIHLKTVVVRNWFLERANARRIK